MNAKTSQKKQKAIKLIGTKKFKEAKIILAKICKQNANDIDAWQLLASTNGQLGDMDAVIQCCKQILRLNPDHTGALSNMGNALSSLGNHSEAETYYEKALGFDPNNPGILNNLGSAYYLSGELEQAVEKFGRAIQLRPDYADAHHNLAKTLNLLDRTSEAIDHFFQAVRFNPDLFEAHLGLANTLRLIQNLERAESTYQTALNIKPDSIEAFTGLIIALRYQGRLDEALAQLSERKQAMPEDHRLIALEADLHERKGNTDKAYTLLKELISTNRINIHAADLYCRICKKYNACDDAITKTNEFLEQGEIDKESQRTLLNALGKLHDKLGNYEEAFTKFKMGNDLAPDIFSKTEHSNNIDSLISTFSPGNIVNFPHARNHSSIPVFIVGMPRSGTSLTEQILASHPQVFGAGELNDINEYKTKLPITLKSNQAYPACMDKLSQDVVDQISEQHLKRLQTLSPEASIVTDKMPHNFINLGLIALLFPGARIIHCTRDPIDTCLSIYFQSFGRTHSYATDLENLGFYYLEYQRLMQHWENVIDIPMITINYEETVSNQEDVSRKLVEFVGLPWDEQCLEFHKSARHIATASYDQVRSKIYTKSLARWKNYEPFIQPLIEALKI